MPRTHKQPRMCTIRSGDVGGGGCLRILSHAKHTAARTDISSDGFPTCSAGAGVSVLTGRRRGQPRQLPPREELQKALRRRTSWKSRRAGKDKNHARGRADRAPLQSSHQHASRAAEPQLRTMKASHRCLIPEEDGFSPRCRPHGRRLPGRGQRQAVPGLSFHAGQFPLTFQWLHKQP